MLFILVYLFIPQKSEAQIFPLKVSSNGRYLITKNGIPFLLNGCSIPLHPESQEELINRLTRLNGLGNNAVYVSIRINETGVTNKIFSKKVAVLKRIAREAALREIAVMVFLDDRDTLEQHSMEAVRFEYLFQKCKNFRNILWLLSERQSDKAPLISDINPKQLIGIYSKELNSADNSKFRVISDMDAIHSDSPTPAVLFIHSDVEVTDSSAFAIRNMVYSGIINGASGIILDQPINVRTEKTRPYNLVSLQLRRFKTVFDTLQWYSFKPFPEISFVSEGFLKVPDASAIVADSSVAVLYFSSGINFPLNLSTFKSALKFSWIDPSTGKVSHSQIYPDPVHQLFMLPVSDRKNADWLLVIRKKRK